MSEEEKLETSKRDDLLVKKQISAKMPAVVLEKRYLKKDDTGKINRNT